MKYSNSLGIHICCPHVDGDTELNFGKMIVCTWLQELGKKNHFIQCKLYCINAKKAVIIYIKHPV